ncbi:ATPase [Neorhizobium sp. BT27B]|jgi:hypothetical protein|uniref:ATPase n=1 Tax=Neorhizobium sp. BT27B TaxID=3142625 RepID=UPI003D2D0F08
MAKPQDFAPMFTEWKLPSAEDVAGGISEEQRAAIFTAVANAEHKKSPQAKNWVGVAVAFELGLDLADEPSKKRVSGLVRALIKEGALVEKEERDPIRRETAVFVRSA